MIKEVTIQRKALNICFYIKSNKIQENINAYFKKAVFFHSRENIKSCFSQP